MFDINPLLSPFEELEIAVAIDSGDWKKSRTKVLIYGVVLGWDNEECFEEFKERFGWDDTTIERLKKLRGNYLKAKELYEKELKGDR